MYESTYLVSDMRTLGLLVFDSWNSFKNEISSNKRMVDTLRVCAKVINGVSDFNIFQNAGLDYSKIVIDKNLNKWYCIEKNPLPFKNQAKF